jgi:hypothetical protein
MLAIHSATLSLIASEALCEQLLSLAAFFIESNEHDSTKQTACFMPRAGEEPLTAGSHLDRARAKI